MTVVAYCESSVQYVSPDGFFSPGRNPLGELTTLPQTP